MTSNMTPGQAAHDRRYQHVPKTLRPMWSDRTSDIQSEWQAIAQAAIDASLMPAQLEFARARAEHNAKLVLALASSVDVLGNSCDQWSKSSHAQLLQIAELIAERDQLRAASQELRDAAGTYFSKSGMVEEHPAWDALEALGKLLP